MSFGVAPFGTAPFGTGLSYDLVDATALTNFYVDLTFDAIVDFGDPLALDTATYVFDGGLLALSVVEAFANVVRVYTSPQTAGFVYTVTVDNNLPSVDGASLGDNEATFSGGSMSYEVSELTASTHCAGRRIDLTWTNPTSPTPVWTKIVRRQKNWVFDLTDAHDVVYDGPVISEFIDSGVLNPQTTLSSNVTAGDTTLNVLSSSGFTIGDLVRLEQLQGPLLYEFVTVTATGVGTIDVTAVVNDYVTTLTNRVALSSSQQLAEQTFYYYTVLVSSIVSPPDTDYTFSDANHVQGLSIAEMDSKESFFWKNTPDYMRERDAQPVGTGGGGFLDKWYAVMGCWLNLMRGTLAATLNVGDDDKAPYNSLSAKNFSLGIDPEGYSYDFEVPRRSVVSLVNVYKRRGTCEGIIRAASMFTKWEVSCAEFALGGCGAGPKAFSTWDGFSEMDQNTDSAPNIVFANRSVIDLTKTWEVDQWKYGLVIGSIGDVACVESNTATELVLREPSVIVTTLDDVVLPGNDVLTVVSTEGLEAQLTIQLESATNSALAEIVEIDFIAGPTTLALKNQVLGTYAVGDKVTIAKSLLRAEMFGWQGVWTTVVGTTRRLTVYTAPNTTWVDNQWVGYKVLTVDNDLLDIVSNDGDSLLVDFAALPTNGYYSIALDFTLGAAFVDRVPTARYRVYSNTHSFIFEPTLNMAQRGTMYDPYSRLWMGPGSSILGAWSDGDVGVYVLTQVALTIGRASTVVLDTLDLDPTKVAPAINEWVGYYLNPNQNQSQLFLIVSNTATTVTVEVDIASLVVAGQMYYVLQPRDASRYRQLVARLGPPAREFANMDITARVLFA